jgi:hypothetical protein
MDKEQDKGGQGGENQGTQSPQEPDSKDNFEFENSHFKRGMPTNDLSKTEHATQETKQETQKENRRKQQ